MITGKVQIYSGYGTESEELLFEDSNLIVDGAGEIICNMLTVPPDSEQAGPRVFDTSNYSIQAISFGKSGLNYFSNAHSLNSVVASGRDLTPPEIWVEQNIGYKGTTQYRHAPVMFSQQPPSPLDEKVTEIPSYYNVVVYPDGEIEEDVTPSSDAGVLISGGIAAWGQNNAGQTNIPPNVGEIKDIDAGYQHAAAITKNGRVICWGRNQEGQSLPPLGLNNASTLGCGLYHTICSKTDGTVTSWGDNSYGQRNLFVTTSAFQIFNDLAITNGHVLALFDEQYNTIPPATREMITAWGSNTNGQLNIPNDILSGVIPEEPPRGVRFFKAKDSLSMAANKYDSSLWSDLFIWGGNPGDKRKLVSYQTFNPATGGIMEVVLPWPNYYIDVAIGPEHCLGLRRTSSSPSAGAIYGGINDALVVWGASGVFTQYPPYDLNLGKVIVPRALSALSYTEIERVQHIENGNSFTNDRFRVYFTSAGQKYVCQWPQHTSTAPYTPYAYDIFTDPLDMVADSGYLYLNRSGNVSGFPTYTGCQNPIPTPVGAPSVSDLRKYIRYTPCDRTGIHYNIPTGIQGSVTSIFQGVNSNGTHFGIAVLSNTSAIKWDELGNVESYGTGFTKVVGDPISGYWKLLKSSGNFLDFPGNLPMDPNGLEVNILTSSTPTNIRKVVAADRYSAALNGLGKLFSTNALPTPEDFASLTLSDISAGELHMLVLKPDGTVSAFGNNSFGQLDIPEGLSDVVEIAAGFYHNAVRKSDGTVVCWGKNDEGQCDVPAGLVATKISAGWGHTLAVNTNNELVVFGRTSEGQSTVPEYADTSALDYTFVPRKISAGGHFNLALYDLYLSSYAQLSDTEINASGPFVQSLSTQVYNSYRYGQNVNLIPFIGKTIDLIYTSSGVREVSLSSAQAYLEGAFAPSGSWTAKVVSGNASAYNILGTYTWPGDLSVAPGAGTLNGRGVVDFRGYVLRKAGGLSQGGGSPSNGTLQYTVTIPVADRIVFDCYGGITSMGLWAFDTQKMLNKNKLPPYSQAISPTDNINNTYQEPIDFKLFAKKVYDVNIVRQSNDSPQQFFDRNQSLTINWTLNFM